MYQIERFKKPSKGMRCKATIFPEHIDGMTALIHWAEGFEAGHGGSVPGLFELIMHLRSMNLEEIQEETNA